MQPASQEGGRVSSERSGGYHSPPGARGTAVPRARVLLPSPMTEPDAAPSVASAPPPPDDAASARAVWGRWLAIGWALLFAVGALAIALGRDGIDRLLDVGRWFR